MMDECVGHMTEKVVIPEAAEIEITPRRYTSKKPEDYLAYEPTDDLVPEIACAGSGYRFHTTGLTHDERGYPAMTIEAQDTLVNRLVNKIQHNAMAMQDWEESQLDGAEVIVLSFGITSRVAREAIEQARDNGLKVGEVRLITVWPFPEDFIRSLARRVRGFVVPEINLGQIALEVERCAAGNAQTVRVSHAGGGVHDPHQILEAIQGVCG
jgi:2-oxoglutarate ferredoxin oxidoreductase subunit alpha